MNFYRLGFAATAIFRNRKVVDSTFNVQLNRKQGTTENHTYRFEKPGIKSNKKTKAR